MDDAKAIETLLAMREDGGVVDDGDWTAAIDHAVGVLRRVREDVNGIYQQIPTLPITADSMDAATDVLTKFCIDFNSMIDLVPVGEDSQ